MKLVWTPKGRRSLREISESIDSNSSMKAAEFMKELFSKVRLLKNTPLMGREVPEIKNPDIREILHGDYRVLYCVKDTVYVFRVIHGRRDFNKLQIRPDIPKKPL